MNKNLILGILIFLIITIITLSAVYIYCNSNEVTPEILENNISKLTYKIHDNFKGGNYDYSKRGYYIDTFNKPNSPYLYIITMGEQPTGGYSITISDVSIDEKNNVEVIVKETKPEGAAITVLTYPACCLELSSYPNSITIKNTNGKVFKEITRQDNPIKETPNNTDIIGKWYPNDITDSYGDRSLSSYFGLNINEKNHFEFFEDKSYIKILGDLDEKGTYKIIDNEIHMTSNSGEITICEIDVDENGTKYLIENYEDITIIYLNSIREEKKEDTNKPLNYNIIRNDYSSYNSQIISNYDQYLSFVNYIDYQNQSFQTNLYDFNSDEYDENYFNTKSIAILNILIGTSMNKLENIDLTIDNNKLICKPTITNPSRPNVVTDITGILISVEIDKSVTEFEIIK